MRVSTAATTTSISRLATALVVKEKIRIADSNVRVGLKRNVV
jgi:hypothetical protein